MKAAVAATDGVAVRALWPDPQLASGEVLVAVRAAALNHRDLLVARGDYGYDLPLVIGSDAAGVRLDTGEAVVVLPALGWGDSDSAPARTFELLGGPRNGSVAELVAVPAENVFPKPERLNWEEASTLGVAALTAYRALFGRARLQPGESVLVLGAGSGVSTFAIQLAAAAGAHVLVTSSTGQRIERAREVGAAGGCLRSDDWPRAIRRLNGGRGVDVVVDGAGATLGESLSACRAGGRVVALGAVAGSEALIPIEQLYRNTSILGTAMGSPREFAALLDFVDHSEWLPVVDSVWPLAEVSAALSRLESGEAFGKVIVRCADGLDS